MNSNLRDKFAIAAIAGMANTFIEAEDLAKRAWSIADAMIKERGRPVIVDLPEPLPEKATIKISPSVLNGEPAQIKTRTKKPKSKPVKKEILPFLDKKGKTIKQLQSEFSESFGQSIPYHQIIYKLERLVDRGKLSVDKRAKPYLWSIPAETVKRKDPGTDPADELKIEFVKHLGCRDISEAVRREGPFEFAEKFEQWKSGN